MQAELNEVKLSGRSRITQWGESWQAWSASMECKSVMRVWGGALSASN